ncbi:hypothetical protein [Egbenema bharatensis]
MIHTTIHSIPQETIAEWQRRGTYLVRTDRKTRQEGWIPKTLASFA